MLFNYRQMRRQTEACPLYSYPLCARCSDNVILCFLWDRIQIIMSIILRTMMITSLTMRVMGCESGSLIDFIVSESEFAFIDKLLLLQ